MTAALIAQGQAARPAMIFIYRVITIAATSPRIPWPLGLGSGHQQILPA